MLHHGNKTNETYMLTLNFVMYCDWMPGGYNLLISTVFCHSSSCYVIYLRNTLPFFLEHMSLAEIPSEMYPLHASQCLGAVTIDLGFDVCHQPAFRKLVCWEPDGCEWWTCKTPIEVLLTDKIGVKIRALMDISHKTQGYYQLCLEYDIWDSVVKMITKINVGLIFSRAGNFFTTNYTMCNLENAYNVDYL